MNVRKFIRILLPVLLFVSIPGTGLSSAGNVLDKNMLFLLDMTRERAMAPLIRLRINTSTPVETMVISDSSTAARYSPGIAADLVPPGSRILDVSKEIHDGVSNIHIDYRSGNFRYIVTYLFDGTIIKSAYDKINEVAYINENDAKISVVRFEVKTARRFGLFNGLKGWDHAVCVEERKMGGPLFLGSRTGLLRFGRVRRVLGSAFGIQNRLFPVCRGDRIVCANLCNGDRIRH